MLNTIFYNLICEYNIMLCFLKFSTYICVHFEHIELMLIYAYVHDTAI